MTAFATACLFTSGAVLTRQSFLWVALVAGAFLLLRERSVARLLGGAALLALALAPLAALAIEWNGLVPPSADPASCGLCTDKPGVGRDSLTLRTVGFTVAVFGLYAAAVLGPGVLRRAPRVDRRLVGAGAAVGVALVLISPLEFRPVGAQAAGDAGYLWQVSKHLPTVLGTSLLFWAAVPLGGAAAAVLARRAGWTSLPSVHIACFLVVVLPVALAYQKYFDPFALLAVTLFARPPDFRGRWDYAGVAAVCAGSVAYALSFAG